MAQDKDYFLNTLKILKSNLSNEDYATVTGVMRALKYGFDFDYKPGYDIDFEYDIETIQKTRRKNNVVKFKVISGDK